MADDYNAIMRKLGARIRAEAEEMGVYSHPDGKGDGREDLILDVLRKRIGTTFGIQKAEISDSLGRRTCEFDGVVFDQSVAASLHSQDSGRQIVRVETVALTLEVKSRLRSEELEKATTDILAAKGERRSTGETIGTDGLIQMYRFFRPGSILRGFASHPAMSESMRVFDHGLNSRVSHEDIPGIVTAAFGYDGVSLDTVAPFIQREVDIVCILGKYTASRQRPGFNIGGGDVLVWGEGDDALGAFLHVIETVLQQFRGARELVWPDTSRYYKHPRPVKEEWKTRLMAVAMKVRCPVHNEGPRNPRFEESAPGLAANQMNFRIDPCCQAMDDAVLRAIQTIARPVN